MTLALFLAAALSVALADQECDTWSGKAPYCHLCKDDDATFCTTCQVGADIDEANGVCIPQCNVPGKEYYVEHCVSCGNYGSSCQQCESGWHTDTFGRQCIKDGTCSDSADPICLKCNNWDDCEVCPDDYSLGRWNDYCEIRCSNYNAKYTEGCQRCSDDRSVCVACNSAYVWVTDDGGTCVPSACARKGLNGKICSGHGTCTKDQYDNPSCTCVGANRDPRRACECNDGYEDSDGDDCVPTPCGGYDTHCSVCKISGSTLTCLECKEGYMDTQLMCKVPKCEGCDQLYDGGARPATCKAGYMLSQDQYTCIPMNTCGDSKMPNCAWCENGKCTKCQLYYTGLAGGCNTRCTDPTCGVCDDNDPSKCLSCPRGIVPDCVPIDVENVFNCSLQGKKLTADGKCTAYSCTAEVYSYFRLSAYGIYAATLSCANHGTCDENVPSLDGWGYGLCKCEEGYDPTTNCVGCDAGYVKDETGSCIKAPSDSVANCGVYAAGKCVSCKAGWSNPGGNCDVRCANPSCAGCAPDDPYVCLTCVYGNGPDNEPPCRPYCAEDCGWMMDDWGQPLVCAYTRDSTDNSVKVGCFSSVCAGDGSVECSGFGSCVNSRCECQTGYRGQNCAYCATGYIQLNNPYGCYKEYSGCAQTCLGHERCVNYKGAATCMSIYCFSGDPANPNVCGNLGTCSPAGFCECNDPNADPDPNAEIPCGECKTGYVMDTSTNKCIRDNCVSGPHAVPYCTQCVTPDSYYCSKCSGGLAPDMGTNTCSKVGGGGSLSGGAIAGIVIAVIIILALAGFLIYWFVFRKSGSSGGGKRRQYVPAMGL